MTITFWKSSIYQNSVSSNSCITKLSNYMSPIVKIACHRHSNFGNDIMAKCFVLIGFVSYFLNSCVLRLEVLTNREHKAGHPWRTRDEGTGILTPSLIKHDSKVKVVPAQPDTVKNRLIFFWLSLYLLLALQMETSFNPNEQLPDFFQVRLHLHKNVIKRLLT